MTSLSMIPISFHLILHNSHFFFFLSFLLDTFIIFSTQFKCFSRIHSWLSSFTLIFLCASSTTSSIIRRKILIHFSFCHFHFFIISFWVSFWAWYCVTFWASFFRSYLFWTSSLFYSSLSCTPLTSTFTLSSKTMILFITFLIIHFFLSHFFFIWMIKVFSYLMTWNSISLLTRKSSLFSSSLSSTV